MRQKSVAIPLYFLEAIFRLLDGFGNFDSLDFHRCGYNPLLDYDNAIWELKLKIQQLQCHMLETYLLSIGGITEDENNALHEWAEAGNSVYSNPYMLYDESGILMDFVNGYRMAEAPSSFFEEYPDAIDDDDWYDGLPF